MAYFERNGLPLNGSREAFRNLVKSRAMTVTPVTSPAKTIIDETLVDAIASRVITVLDAKIKNYTQTILDALSAAKDFTQVTVPAVKSKENDAEVCEPQSTLKIDEKHNGTTTDFALQPQPDSKIETEQSVDELLESLYAEVDEAFAESLEQANQLYAPAANSKDTDTKRDFTLHQEPETQQLIGHNDFTSKEIAETSSPEKTKTHDSENESLDSDDYDDTSDEYMEQDIDESESEEISYDPNDNDSMNDNEKEIQMMALQDSESDEDNDEQKEINFDDPEKDEPESEKEEAEYEWVQSPLLQRIEDYYVASKHNIDFYLKVEENSCHKVLERFKYVINYLIRKPNGRKVRTETLRIMAGLMAGITESKHFRELTFYDDFPWQKPITELEKKLRKLCEIHKDNETVYFMLSPARRASLIAMRYELSKNIRDVKYAFAAL